MMRKFGILVTGAVVGTVVMASFIGVAPAGATTSRKASKPVQIDGKVNVKGTKDIGSKKFASVEIEADDYYFEPTFLKVQPGEKVRITVKNEGDETHTFTSDGLNIDQQVTAGKAARFTLTVPSDGTAFEFHCNFHGDMGMKGAVYTKPGGTAT
jgi:plastocyanin